MDETKLHSGQLYDPSIPEIALRQELYKRLINRYNRTSVFAVGRRKRLLKRIMADIGQNVWIEPPFHSNFGGKHTHIGNNVYANFNLTLVDDTHIYIGDNTMIGPNVALVTAGHPVLPELRMHQLQYNFPVRIGKNCWLGANVTVLPGVTIGDNTVIGAGSVVTRDIPSNVVAFGVPCKVSREISDRDKEYYFRDNKIKNQT